ncbi:DUF418 domain-containing protein [Kribbella catacumbae]|uniref:DUF418 domain-containing protein n=1 Tax=Kribbella catacumbae TaxID=460086 RepID=UPI0003A2F5EE|nr:DUF418 domain-containing protein [Kribbella catacumbae]
MGSDRWDGAGHGSRIELTAQPLHSYRKGESPAAAVLVWTVSVAGAYQMKKRSYRGPAETLLRKLTY